LNGMATIIPIIIMQIDAAFLPSIY